jgi:hypothetical protein
MNTKAIFLFIIGVIGCAGCSQVKSNHPNYIATIRSGATAVPIAVEMERTFPATDHFIEYFARGHGPRRWNTQSYFGERYELTMQVDVEINFDALRITGIVGEPKFYLKKADRVEVLPDGRAVVSYRGDQPVFGAGDWAKVYKAGGDFSVIGITIDRTPVKDFDKYVNHLRRSFDPIRLSNGQ